MRLSTPGTADISCAHITSWELKGQTTLRNCHCTTHGNFQTTLMSLGLWAQRPVASSMFCQLPPSSLALWPCHSRVHSQQGQPRDPMVPGGLQAATRPHQPLSQVARSSADQVPSGSSDFWRGICALWPGPAHVHGVQED
ncbi:hypothetical protein P7K49_006001 [Saguinus oedipus]|uniref:Uncharacterized protein n=1 Tax=Saguinus oedipus TaxID=9490 RepID=A0ABQ9W1P6_SAGOE|nr:hypothetical protein P7K49_006001 [Saguinus oedipus]